MKKIASILAFLLFSITSVYAQKITTYKTEKVKGCWNKYYCGVKGDNHYVLGSDTKSLYLVKFDEDFKLVNSIQLDFKEKLWTFSTCFIADNAVNLIYFTQDGYYSKSFNFDGSLKKELTLKEKPKRTLQKFELLISENKKFFALLDISVGGEFALSTKVAPGKINFKSIKGAYSKSNTSNKIKVYDASLNVVEEINLEKNIRIESTFLSDDGAFYYIDFSTPQTSLVKRLEGETTKQNLKFSGAGETHIYLKQIKDKVAISYSFGKTDFSFNNPRFNTTGFSFNLLNSNDLSYVYETSFDVDKKDLNSMLSDYQQHHPKQEVLGLESLVLRDVFLTPKNEMILYFERAYINYQYNTATNLDFYLMKVDASGKLDQRYFPLEGKYTLEGKSSRAGSPYITLVDNELNIIYNDQRNEIRKNYLKVIDINFQDVKEQNTKSLYEFQKIRTKIGENKYIEITGVQKDIEITVLEF